MSFLGLSIFGAFKRALQFYWQNALTFLKLFLVYMLVIASPFVIYFGIASLGLIFDGWPLSLSEHGPMSRIIFGFQVWPTNSFGREWLRFFDTAQILSGCLIGLCYVGFNNVCLKIIDGQKVTLKDYFVHLSTAVKFILALVGCYLLLIAGLVAFLQTTQVASIFLSFFMLIITGIGLWVYLRFYFAPYFIIDKNLSIRESFKASSIITRNIGLWLLVLDFAIFGFEKIIDKLSVFLLHFLANLSGFVTSADIVHVMIIFLITPIAYLVRLIIYRHLAHERFSSNQ
jgi:hypothetical protein